MGDKVAGFYTVRGVMKGGRVELLDDVEIENGSLLDITVVKTATQLRLEAQAATRTTKGPGAIRFRLGGRKMTDDALLAFRNVPKSGTTPIRFDGYSCTATIVLDDAQCALAEYALAISNPPPAVSKAIRSGVGKRKRMALSPGTKAADALQISLCALLDEQDVDDENALSLWHIAAAAATQDNQYISAIVTELSLHAAEMNLCQAHPDGTGGHGVDKDRAAALREHEEALREILLAQIAAAVQRARRRLSGNTETEKLMKKEFKEIFGRIG